MPILHRLLQKIEDEEIFPQLFCKASITLILNPDKCILKKETRDQYAS